MRDRSRDVILASGQRQASRQSGMTAAAVGQFLSVTDQQQTELIHHHSYAVVL